MGPTWAAILGLVLVWWVWIPPRVLGAEAAAAPDQLTCTLLTVEGSVEVKTKSSPAWTPGQTNLVLRAGDQLRTGFRSRAVLQWSDLSVVRVRALTTMELQAPAPGKSKPQLDLKSGSTYFFSREAPSEIEFRTPVASGAIRGTEFNLAVSENGRTEVSLLEGEVELANAQGQQVLRSGDQGVVERGQGPSKTALIDAINIIQWVLYYPAVIDAGTLPLTEAERQAFRDSMQAYVQGDLTAAARLYPANPPPASDAGRTWSAALLLAVGEVDQAMASIANGPVDSGMNRALRELVAAVKHQTLTDLPAPNSASEWLGRSYYLQSQGRLEEALAAAKSATSLAPEFGAAWIRLAELEFSFGRGREAALALNTGLKQSPRNAQGLALKGFLLGAANHTEEALATFDQAIAIDGALGNAWLGRGLIKFRQGQPDEGRKDLQVAATLEPQRSVLRSYLGKAFSHTQDQDRAAKELDMAVKLDPNDPTPWLYAALLDQQQNRINDAIGRLERSRELNDNRSVYRSQLLLDQDQAVRSANLASMYKDAGMTSVGFQEASRAVDDDYANHSAHLFLANSYDALRDPKSINLRYESAWLSELLVAQLLAPPSGGNLSQTVSQQEYARFFEGNHLGVYSGTEYLSSGDWIQTGSQYGILGNTGYALDTYYRNDSGQRPNNDLEQLIISGRVKQQLTAQDSVFFQVGFSDSDSGDLNQYYNQNSADKTLKVSEEQEPNLLFGYHREWTPGSHTLFLAGRFDDDLSLKSADPGLNQDINVILPVPPFAARILGNPQFFSLDYDSDLSAYSTELQHFWQTPEHTFIVGGRYQVGWNDSESRLLRQPPLGLPTQINTEADTELDRISVYAYEHWQILEPLRLTAGVSYDRLHYPRNVDSPPIDEDETTDDQWSPKAGILWTPSDGTQFRGAYTRSLGGVFFDTSVRLEPSQINGFNQAFRSLIPESVEGLVAGTEFDTYGVGWDQRLASRTYLVVDAEYLKSEGDRTVGLLVNSSPVVGIPDTASSTPESLDYKEKSVRVSLNQLVGRDFALGSQYRLTLADLDKKSPTPAAQLNDDVSGVLHQVVLYGIFNHPSGWFGLVDAVWSQQSNQDYNPDIPGDDFWQFNAYVGYRFWQRRMEARVGVLNLADQDYRLNPLTLYNELPRERTIAARLKFYF